MENNVVSLVQQEPRIWVCECGCKTFYLLDTGDVECSACNKVSDSCGGWTPHQTSREYLGDAFSDTHGVGGADFARRLVISRANDVGVNSIVVINTDGRVIVWTDAETHEQVSWVRRQLAQALGVIKRGVK